MSLPPESTKRDLVLDAIAHRETWRIPHMIVCQPTIRRALAEYYRVDDVKTVLDNAVEWITDASFEHLSDSNVLQNGEYTDAWGVDWHGVGETRGQVKSAPLREPTLQGYRFPQQCPPRTLARMKDEAERSPGLFRVAKLGALWEQATFLRHMEELLADLILHPNFVHDLLEGVLDVLLKYLEVYRSELDVECIWLSDDYGAQSTMLMSPRLWREFIGPRLRRISDAVHAAGYYFALHSDGAINDVLSDIVDSGVDILHPVQPECIDVGWIKREFGRHLTLWGCYGTQRTMVLGAPSQIRQEVDALCDLLGAGGGFILSPGISIGPETPIENAVAFIDIAREREQGRS